MARIKNDLTTSIKTDTIPKLLQYTKEEYRPYDPGQYLYNLVTEFPNEMKFTNKFIELVYTTLIAWNMNQRSAKLSNFDLFKESLIKHEQTIKSLEQYRIENLDYVDNLKETIVSLFKNLKLVAKNKPKLVTFSKTLHFFLPNLLMPVDRSYTLLFFYNNTNFNKTDDEQIQIYCDIFEQFRQFAKVWNYANYVDEKWNKNIPKMIDNIIIAYIKQREK